MRKKQRINELKAEVDYLKYLIGAYTREIKKHRQQLETVQHELAKLEGGEF